jgi:hypothetical protein
MSKKEKLFFKAEKNPSGLRFEEFQRLMIKCRWTQDHQKGSHQIWYSPDKYRISVQNRKGKAKSYQVKQFLARYYQEEEKDGR